MTARRAGLDERTAQFIRWNSIRLAGRGAFAGYAPQDLQQELLLECWKALPRFDHKRACRRTFFQRVIHNLIASTVEAQSAACRDYRRCRRSINEPVAFSKNCPEEFGDSISDNDYQARMGRAALSAYERAELQIDVRAVIATLPPELAAVALVLKSEGVVEAGYRLGLSRSTVYRRVANIRALFQSAGLDLYLSRRGPASVRRPHESVASARAGLIRDI